MPGAFRVLFGTRATTLGRLRPVLHIDAGRGGAEPPRLAMWREELPTECRSITARLAPASRLGGYVFTRRFLTATLTLALATGCNPFHREPAVQVSARDATLNTRWHANLASPASLAGAVQMNGSASMAPGRDGTSTRITVDLANATPGGLHPWAAHAGQCGLGMDDGLFGPGESYTPLRVGADGQASVTATVKLPTPTSGQHFVVIYASAANPETIVACGNLAPPTE